MNYILFDGEAREALLPFTFTRPVSEIRLGVLSIKEKWEKYLGCTTTCLTEEYLEKKFPMVEFEENIFINGSVLPTIKLVEEIEFLSENQGIIYKEEIIAFFSNQDQKEVDFEQYEFINFEDDLIKINNKWDIFTQNNFAIQQDFELLKKDKTSAVISNTNTIVGPLENVFLEEGVIMECVVINAIDGPVYISKNAIVMEGSLIRGPFALGEKSVVKMGAKIYGGTTVGPNCTVGGEIKNAVFFGNSNKGHDGYLGNSVVGEWCNFGADTNVSNMKNNHSEINIWDYSKNKFVNSDLKFCGLFLGDYSKLGINTMINTGTVIGVSANVFGSGFPKKFIPSFSWCGDEPITDYLIEKAIVDASKMCSLKKELLSADDADIIKHIFQETQIYR